MAFPQLDPRASCGLSGPGVDPGVIPGQPSRPHCLYRGKTSCGGAESRKVMSDGCLLWEDRSDLGLDFPVALSSCLTFRHFSSLSLRAKVRKYQTGMSPRQGSGSDTWSFRAPLH